MNLSKKLFMLRKLVTDLTRGSIPFVPNDDNESQQLGYYYFRFEENPSRLNRLIKTFDADGVPLNTTYVDVTEKQLHYYPISIGQYGLAVFHSYLNTGSGAKREHFLRIARWFREHVVNDERLGAYWLTSVPKPEYKVFSPWKSAFAQSRAISVLLRAWQLTQEKEYYFPAARALLPFTFDIRAGGVSANLLEGHPFYEEYVASEPTMVLDGHIFALFGLYDFVRVTRDQESAEAVLARRLFRDGVESLLYWLPEFDLGYWVRFNLCRMSHYPAVDPCTRSYLRLIIEQLKILGLISRRKELLSYAGKFITYDSPKNTGRMYLEKLRALKGLQRW